MLLLKPCYVQMFSSLCRRSLKIHDVNVQFISFDDGRIVRSVSTFVLLLVQSFVATVQ